MKKRESFQNIIFGIAALIFIGSCDDDAIPLRDPGDTQNEEFVFTWPETADSLQAATYNTYLGSDGTFIQDNAGETRFHYWWNSHMLDVLVDGYLRTGDENYVPRMKALVQGIGNKNGGTYRNVFNDDMEWLGNASIRAYNATGDEEFKEVAEFVWEEIKKSWSDLYGGGITWRSDRPLGKNATSNAPAAILAMRLFEAGGNEQDLQWAKDIYQWQKSILVDSASGLVWDNINEENGEVVINKDWIFTYNIGTYIGAGLKLYEETGEEVYLRDAVRTAKSMMASPKLTTEGLLRDEGQGDGGLFKGILVRYFTLLIQQPGLSESDRTSFLDFMKFNAKTFYQKGIKRPAMLAGPNWREQPGERTDLSTQLSGVMLMEAAARLEEAGVWE